MKRIFTEHVRTEHGTVRFVENDMTGHIEAYWGCRKSWEELPEDVNDFEHFQDWDKVIPLDHGYDETKPENELSLEDVKGAAKFRGGVCRTDHMMMGNWNAKLKFTCAFGHEFEASSRLVLEGGHWCPVCERNSWNYAARAKADSFFAQVWNPLHGSNAKECEYRKEVTELDI